MSQNVARNLRTVPTAGPVAAPPAHIDALALALERTHPELWTPGRLPGETLEGFHARREAALDIFDDLLAEAAAELAR